MGFYDIIEKYKAFDFENYCNSIKNEDIINSLNKTKLNDMDFLNIISNKAEKYIEIMAKKSMDITRQYFGRTISLYTPMYISNYCTNRCIYCGFNKDNKIKRAKLTLEEIEKEAIEIAKTGLKHLLVLTGEADTEKDFIYLKDSIKLLSNYFPSISIEVFPMDTDKYIELKKLGVDGLTVYQETYNKELYEKVHLAGKKKRLSL